MIAEILDRFEPGAIGWTVMGLVAALSVACLALTAYNQARRALGRRPTVNELIAGLVSLAKHDEHREEVRLRCLGLEKQISEARHAFDQRANTDLVQNEKRAEVIFRLIAEADGRSDRLSGVISRLEERTESHIRKFDSLEGKLDRTIERLPHPDHRHPIRNSDE